MRPTQRSVLARQRNRSLDDTWRVVTVGRATMTRTFPKTAVMAIKILSVERNMFRCVLLSHEQKKCRVDEWFPSSATSAIPVFLWKIMSTLLVQD